MIVVSPTSSLCRAASWLVAVAVVASLWLPIAAPAATAAPIAAASTFSFAGGGFGHGVGMSQYGAKRQGLENRSEAQILGSYYPGTAITGASPPGPIVLLPRSDCGGIAASTSTTLAPVGGRIELFIGGPSFGSSYYGLTSVLSGRSATVTVTGDVNNYYRIESDELPGGYTYPGSTPQDWVFVVLHGVPTQLGMNSTRYSRGNLVLTDNGVTAVGGALNAYAQDMTMNEYLYGLAEVPSSWPAATLRAQAIAGRTYAERVAAPRRNAGSRFHIYGSTLDQCYRGYEKEGEVNYGGYWTAAVDATDGQVLAYNGALAQTFYTSSNGGYSERSGYVFAQDLPYLVAQPDPWDNAPGNSLYRWTRTFDGDDLGARIGGGVGRVTSLAVSGSVGVSGRINKASVAVTGTTGTRTITGSQLRSLLGLPDTLLFMIARDCTVLFGTGTPCPNVLPAGGYDSAIVSGSSALVQGWAADPDSNAPVEIDVYVNGAFAGWGYASQSRPDVGAAYPQYGSNRGFSISVPVPVGSSSVCAYAIDVNYPGTNRGLGCRSVSRSGGSPPFGNYEAIARVPGGAQVQGWVIDPDTTAPVEVHVYSGGQIVGYGWASGTRSDVGAAYPGYGTSHGFAINTSLGSGTHSVCVYAINVPSGNNPSLGCRSIVVSPNPIGNLDAVVRSGSTAVVQGWSLDPDVSASTEIDVYVDGGFAGWGYASQYRSDIGAAFPLYGPDHGFSLSVPVAAGAHQVCAYAINAGPGWANPLLGCRNV